MDRRMFISIEGGEGSGKSSIIDMLRDDLQQRGIDVMATREPGGVEISERIRSIILDRENTRMDMRTEALLYAAARSQHLREKVLPALEAGKVVLCDRYVDSSLAYQGYARGIGVEEVLAINQFAIDGVLPDLTLYFDVMPETGLARINHNKEREINRLDLERVSFHHKVREGYLQLVERFSDRIVLIDANQSMELVFRQAKQVIDKKIGYV